MVVCQDFEFRKSSISNLITGAAIIVIEVLTVGLMNLKMIEPLSYLGRVDDCDARNEPLCRHRARPIFFSVVAHWAAIAILMLAADVFAQPPVAAEVLRQAQNASNNKDWPAAEKLLRSLVTAGSAESYVHRRLGYVIGEQGLHQEAIQHYVRATELAPELAVNWTGLCWRRILINQPAAAQLACLKAQSLDNLNRSATVILGHTYLLQGDRAEAWRWYDDSIGLMDGDADWRDGLLDDLNLFQQRSWQVELTQQTRAEFDRKAQIWLDAVRNANVFLMQIKSAENDVAALSLREQHAAALSRHLRENHPRRVALADALAKAKEAVRAIKP